jgi:hypothetical protein
MFLMNSFLGEDFWSYGPRFVSFMTADEEGSVDPTTHMFPKMVKCTFHKYGASGALHRYDTVCVLPLNALYGWFYAFLWFWFIVLFGLTSAWFIFMVSIIRSTKLRTYVLGKRFGHLERNAIAQMDRHCGIGDWFLFCMLAENLDSRIFRDVMNQIFHRLGTHRNSMIQVTEDL